MAKFKDFYLVQQGVRYGFLEVVANQKQFCTFSDWYYKLGQTDRQKLNTYINLHIGNRELVDCLEYDEPSMDIISDVLSAYTFKLNGLLETTLRNEDFDILDNKNRSYTRTETVTNKYGDIETTNNNGQRYQSNSYGQRSNTETIGGGTDTTSRTLVYDEVNQSISKGATEQTNEYDDTKITTTVNKSGGVQDTHVTSQMRSPFDGGSDYNKATVKDTTTDTLGERINEEAGDSRTDTIKTKAVTDSTSTDERTDTDDITVITANRSNTQTLGSATDTVTINSSTDTSKVEHDDDKTTVLITETEHGNIGVTQTSELLENARNGIYNFVFYDYVVEILLHEFAKSFCWE